MSELEKDGFARYQYTAFQRFCQNRNCYSIELIHVLAYVAQ